MSFWDDVTTAAYGGAPAGPNDLASDPILGPLLAAHPELIQQMTGGGAAADAGPLSLTEALVGSAMDVTGRYGITGKGASVPLPTWAQDLAPEALSNPDFDPFFGQVSQQGDERVYFGTKNIKPPKAEVFAEGKATPDEASGGDLEFRSGGQREGQRVTDKGASKTDKTLTSIQAMNLPYTWDEEEIADAMKKMQAAGIPVTSFDMGDNSLLNVWGGLVQRAAMTYSMSEGKRKVSPWDVLDLYKSESIAAGTYQDPNRSETRVSKSVSEITEGQAWTVLRSTISQMLGHDPSDQELRDYTYRMNQMAAKNPSISKTITQYKNGEEVSSSTHTSGGFTQDDAAQAAYERAQNDPDYAEYQSATTYFNAAMSALGPIGG